MPNIGKDIASKLIFIIYKKTTLEIFGISCSSKIESPEAPPVIKPVGQKKQEIPIEHITSPKLISKNLNTSSRFIITSLNSSHLFYIDSILHTF